LRGEQESTFGEKKKKKKMRQQKKKKKKQHTTKQTKKKKKTIQFEIQIKSVSNSIFFFFFFGIFFFVWSIFTPMQSFGFFSQTMTTLSLLTTLLASVALMTSTTEAIWVDLNEAGTWCFLEEVPLDTLVLAQWVV
jgi:uncharacterized ion transporter superfamily protein YfcC